MSLSVSLENVKAVVEKLTAKVKDRERDLSSEVKQSSCMLAQFDKETKVLVQNLHEAKQDQV